MGAAAGLSSGAFWGKGCHLSSWGPAGVPWVPYGSSFSVSRCCVWLNLFHELSEILEALSQSCLIMELRKGRSDNQVCLGSDISGLEEGGRVSKCYVIPFPQNHPTRSTGMSTAGVCVNLLVLLVVG